MANAELAAGTEGQQEKNDRVQEWKNILARVKKEIKKKVDSLWDKKEFEPITRTDFKIVVRPENLRIFTTGEIITFRMMDDYFEKDALAMLERIGKIYPNNRLIMEFLLFPYENGGRKMIPEAYFKPLAGDPPAPEAQIPANNTATRIKDEVILTPTQRVEAEISRKKAELKHQIEVAEALPANAAPVEVPVTENPAPTGTVKSEKAASSTLQKLTMMIRETNSRSSETAELSGKFMDSPIDYDLEKWDLRGNSVLKRIRKALSTNGIRTPRELLACLGTDYPTKREWYDFIAKLDSAIGPNWLGVTGSRDLCYWMRKFGLIQRQFREESK